MSGKYVFSKALKELRFHHCQTSDHSNAIRSFLTRAYPTMKHHNPHTPILIREAMNIQPRVFARYEFGKEKMADLQGMWDRLRERLSCHVKWKVERQDCSESAQRFLAMSCRSGEKEERRLLATPDGLRKWDGNVLTRSFFS
ncbi:hypothetical protein D0862_14290 [Hortaea werneckii]|uniref:Ribosomal protein/NADH dehydrogenase domain-containing protein n=1 Tax=Hortaea werneckii TaxID=91943 RepID=A0A3M7EAK3_HORWE|nr:hypothetical protein D0862_14290 [Hortaea werneckii]